MMQYFLRIGPEHNWSVLLAAQDQFPDYIVTTIVDRVYLKCASLDGEWTTHILKVRELDPLEVAIFGALEYIYAGTKV